MDGSPTTENWERDYPEYLGTKGVVLPEKITQLRQKLYEKAKREPRFRFYALYGHITRLDVLQTAWRIARSHNGVAGVDGVTFAQIEQSEGGVEEYLARLQQALQTRTYRADAVRRVYIPKPNGKQRPLGIPVIRDRVVQTAVLLILEPIFEADFEDCSYGFRPERSAHGALGQVWSNLRDGRTAVYDADLKSYFDTIPHENLVACVRRRIVDGTVLRLIQMWLDAPIEERDESGRKRRWRSTQGTPQGGVISPLLANLYLHWFDKLFNRCDGPRQWANARIVRYADDFVVMARFMGGRIVEFIETTLEGRFGLSINREKTRCVDLRKEGESLHFLGFTFRYDRDLRGRGHRYWNLGPSDKALKRERADIREKTGSSQCYKPVKQLIDELNDQLRGWANYYRYGYPRKALRSINWYVRERLTRHLRRRSQRPMRPAPGTSYYQHLQRLGLIYL